jgi:hypothetical protein
MAAKRGHGGCRLGDTAADAIHNAYLSNPGMWRHILGLELGYTVYRTRSAQGFKGDTAHTQFSNKSDGTSAGNEDL